MTPLLTSPIRHDDELPRPAPRTAIRHYAESRRRVFTTAGDHDEYLLRGLKSNDSWISPRPSWRMVRIEL